MDINTLMDMIQVCGNELTNNPTFSAVMGGIVACIYGNRANKDKISESIKNKVYKDVVGALYETGVISAKEYWECNNFMSIAEETDKLLKDVTIDIKKIDINWMFRFFDYASKVTEEDIRMMWGRVLAREFSDNAVTPELLHTISLLTKNDIIKFVLLSRLVFHEYGSDELHPFIFFTANREWFETYGLDAKDLHQLDRLGLIIFDKDENVYFGEKRLLYGNHELLVRGNCEDGDRIKAGNVIFTKAGKFLFSLIEYDYVAYSDFVLENIMDRFKNRKCSVYLDGRLQQ